MKIGKILLVLILTVGSFALTGPLYPRDPIIIKIATITPEGTPWAETIKRIGREWRRITKGKVEFKVYTARKAGNETEIVKQLKQGDIEGAGISSEALALIYPDIVAISIPFLCADDEEFNAVFDKMKPLFEKEIHQKGFKVIGWQLAGWTRIFSKNPVFYPKDLQEHIVSITGRNQGAKYVLESSGFNVVPIQFNQLREHLENDKVTAFYLPPYWALISHYFPLAPNISEFKLFPMAAAVLITNETWDKIPGIYKKEIEKIDRVIENETYKRIEQLEDEAVEKMVENDLTICKLPADALEKWRKTITRGVNASIGKFCSKEVYHQVRMHLKRYREKIARKVQNHRR